MGIELDDGLVFVDDFVVVDVIFGKMLVWVMLYEGCNCIVC